MSGAKVARVVERKVRSSWAGALGTVSRALRGAPVESQRRLGAADQLARLAHLRKEPHRISCRSRVLDGIGRRRHTARR